MQSVSVDSDVGVPGQAPVQGEGPVLHLLPRRRGRGVLGGPGRGDQDVVLLFTSLTK